MILLDYSAGRPSGDAIRASGASGSVRYVGFGRASKRLTRAEYDNLKASGLIVWAVAEEGTTDARGTYANGQRIANGALSDLANMGITEPIPIFCTEDSHLTGTGVSVSMVLDFVRGFTSVMGKQRAGFYGFMEAVRPVHDSGLVSYTWLAGSQPSSHDKTWLTMWQDNTQTTQVAGITCDINHVYTQITGGGAVEDIVTPEDIEAVAKRAADLVLQQDIWDQRYPSLVDDGSRNIIDYLRNIEFGVYRGDVVIDYDVLADKVAARLAASQATANADELKRRLES